MTARALAFVAIRLFALLLILWAIGGATSGSLGLAAYFLSGDDDGSITLWAVLLPFVSSLVYVAVASVMLVGTETLVRLVTAGLPSDSVAIDVSHGGAARIAYAVAGMCFVLFGLEDVGVNVAAWHFTERPGSATIIPGLEFSSVELIAGVIKVGVGLALVATYGRGVWLGQRREESGVERRGSEA